jgi:hypothetical protein
MNNNSVATLTSKLEGAVLATREHRSRVLSEHELREVVGGNEIWVPVVILPPGSGSTPSTCPNFDDCYDN